jgi:vancomycin permeability regulator SanA
MISRAIAAFLGGFTLLNLLGNLIAPGFDANLWWIDLHHLPKPLAYALLLFSAVVLLAYACRPTLTGHRKAATIAVVTLLAAVTFTDAIRFYILLSRHIVTTSVPIPFSLLICIALITVAWRAARPSRSSPHRPRLVFASALATCFIGFPLAQMFFFGHTDYRRHADAIVVFGARAYADGTPSGVLADRVRTGCRLYLDGMADTLVFSGGPGDGAIDEPQCMRRMALAMGVPDSAIRLDHAGVNTDATVRNTTSFFRDEHIRRVMAVSHSYHLPRIKMSYRQAGWEVYTVPAKENYRLPGRRYLLLRETVTLWAYYLHPLRTSQPSVG